MFPTSIFKASLNKSLFKIMRQYLYLRYRPTEFLSQGEVIHDVSKKYINDMENEIKKNANYFNPSSKLNTIFDNFEINNPVGLAAGFDKDCEIVTPMSYMFGFLTVGTVLLNPNEGNHQDPLHNKPRLVVDSKKQSIVNSQGYPQKGLDYTVEKLKQYSKNPHGNAKIVLSFSGITEEKTQDQTLDSLKQIILLTRDYVDAYEENRSSPNTPFNRDLFNKDMHVKIHDVLQTHAPGKLFISKFPSYVNLPPSDDENQLLLKSAKIFYDIGIDGLVINNSRMVDVSSVGLVGKFANNVAGESGNPLFPYTLKQVSDIHSEIPNLKIIACGGISDGTKVWELLTKGASLFELYSGLSFYGFGVIHEIHNTLTKRLAGQTLTDYIEKRDKKF